EMFPDRRNDQREFEVPKTLIFAKSDSHADDIIQIVRTEFGEGNDFCKKVTYRSLEDPKSILTEFRTNYYPRIAVTVDMIATGTDVKPLECLLFMRDVKSRNYFEQMKGRGTRTITLDDLKKVSPSAKFAKDRFVLVDAIGVSKSLKTDSRPLEKQPSVALKDLLGAIAVRVRDEALFSSLAGRLLRLDKRLTETEKQAFQAKAQGKTIPQVARELINAFDPDVLEGIEVQVLQEMPQASVAAQEERIAVLTQALQEEAARVFTGDLNHFIENVHRVHEQVIDHINPDRLLSVGWAEDQQTQAEDTVQSFTEWIVSHREEITALQLFYPTFSRLF
ncbi:MAG: restriction endonuclease subunit R, partial [Microcystaceae cyanobacterium]